MTARMLYIHALSPIHVGMGQGVGVIDLPVIREAVTGWPYLPGSSLTGVLRDACDGKAPPDDIRSVFGAGQGDDPSQYPGGASFADGRLLCLPVRAYAGGFAWVTSPLALNRWARDCALTGNELPAKATKAVTVADSHILLTDEAKKTIVTGGDVYLEDLKLTVATEAPDTFTGIAKTIADACFDDGYWHGFFQSHVGVVTDTTFSFLARTATEITARNRIDDAKKIVAEGQLWWEEAAPAETIFAGPVVATARPLAAATFTEVLAAATDGTLQIGGNATVGRGLARVRLNPVGGAT